MKLCCYFVGFQAYDSAMIYVVCFISFLVGLPGNILSASVWFRARITAENSSAIYLGALAVVDLVSVCSILVFEVVKGDADVPHLVAPVYQVFEMLYYLGAAFVLVVSAERLIFYRFPSLVS